MPLYDGKPQGPTAFERIMSQQVPEWARQFEGKSRDYNSASTGWEPHTFLGVRGQFADIWRKVGKLKKSLWDSEELTGEQPREIIQDMISHLFLTLDLMDSGVEPPIEVKESQVTKITLLQEATGHRYDGCRICVETREAYPELIV